MTWSDGMTAMIPFGFFFTTCNAASPIAGGGVSLARLDEDGVLGKLGKLFRNRFGQQGRGWATSDCSAGTQIAEPSDR